jgi:hypothetical protein
MAGGVGVVLLAPSKVGTVEEGNGCNKGNKEGPYPKSSNEAQDSTFEKKRDTPLSKEIAVQDIPSLRPSFIAFPCTTYR